MFIKIAKINKTKFNQNKTFILFLFLPLKSLTVLFLLIKKMNKIPININPPIINKAVFMGPTPNKKIIVRILNICPVLINEARATK